MRADVANRVGQPANIEGANLEDTLCDEELHLKVKGCLAATERPAYEDRLVSRLAALSCEDVSIAEGIIRSRLRDLRISFKIVGDSLSLLGHSPSAFHRNLAAALLAKADQPDCKGLRELSQDEKDQLKEMVKKYDEQAGKESEPRP